MNILNQQDPKNIIGKRFGRWITLEYLGKLGSPRYWYRFQCNCGHQKHAQANNFLKGKPIQCRVCNNREKRLGLNP